MAVPCHEPTENRPPYREAGAGRLATTLPAAAGAALFGEVFLEEGDHVAEHLRRAVAAVFLAQARLALDPQRCYLVGTTTGLLTLPAAETVSSTFPDGPSGTTKLTWYRPTEPGARPLKATLALQSRITTVT